VYWPSAQVVSYIDAARAEVAQELGLDFASWVRTTSAGVGQYALSAHCAGPVHVFWLSAGTGAKFQYLEPAGIIEFALGQADIEVSGTPTRWAVDGADGQMRIRLIPAPDCSAVSGLFVLGKYIPESIEVSALLFPLHVRQLACIKAAVWCWQERGVDSEVTRLEKFYDKQLKAAKLRNLEASPWFNDLQQLGLDGFAFSHTGMGIARTRGYPGVWPMWT
jgi:hypothetical protein